METNKVEVDDGPGQNRCTQRKQLGICFHIKSKQGPIFFPESLVKIVSVGYFSKQMLSTARDATSHRTP